MTFVSCANDLWHQNGESASEGGLIEFTATTTTAVDETRGGMDPLKVTGYKKQLWLIPTVEDAAKDVTRGTQLTSTSILQNFGVSAYLHGKTEDITEKRPDFFYNKEAVRDATTGKYSFDQDYYWPSSNEYLSFMAYAPYGSTLATLADIGASEPAKGAQKISFTVAEDVANQVDLMTATAMQQTPSTTSTPSVNLQFEHQLAGIRFVVGDQFPTQGYIQKITLKNVYASGIYTLSDGATPGSWSYGSRYNYVAGTADQELTGEVGQAITTEAQTFLMLPCTFANNDVAAVEIDYWDGYAKHTVTASLAGVTWEAGKTYTYELSSQNLTKLKVQSIAFAPTISDAPHSKWQTGDKVGLYVVQGKDAQGATDGHTLRYKNIPVTCTVSMVGSNEVVTWAVDHTTTQGNVYKYPGDSYYFYYPYKEGTPDGYPNECNELNASAPTFFSSVITAHTVFTDQSGVGAAAGNFEKSDLQVAKAVVPEDDGSNLPASTIKGAMERQVGLARMKFATSKTIPTVVTRTNNGTASNSGTTTIYPSSNFSGNKPYLSGGVYYFFTKAGTSTTFNSVASDVNHWYSAHTFNLGAGEYTSDVDMNTQLVQDYRYQWQFVRSIYNYSYRGAGSTFTMPINGYCAIECWGAEGGSMNGWLGGKGAYTYGKLGVSSSTKLYVFVGAMGTSAMSQGTTLYCAGSFNGAGSSEYNYGRPGGGATDVRLQVVAENTTNWKDFNSLRSRIMVAAGGGGCVNRNTLPDEQTHQTYGDGHGGYGGGLVGGDGTAQRNSGGYGWCRGFGATQTSPGKSVGELLNPSSHYPVGDVPSMFGAFGYSPTNCGQGTSSRPEEDSQGTGGGGYYGGGSSGHAGSGGGSSFISGHPGCRALDISNGRSTSQSNLVHKAESASDYNVHYSGYKFTNTSMIAGNAIQTKPGGGTETGHTGHGYCRITVTYE